MSSNKQSKPGLEKKEAASSAGIMDESFMVDDNLAIDPVLLREINGKGLAYRWINSNKLKQNFGFDPRRWSPYKRESSVTPGFESFGYTDSEGYVRRGDLVLAVQPAEIALARKQKIANKNKTLAELQHKGAVDQIKESFRRAGMRAKIHDDYED